MVSKFLVYLAVIVLLQSTLMSQTICEEGSAILDLVVDKAKDKDLVIVIARLGEKERSGELNRRRLHNVKAYLTEYRAGTIYSRHPDNIILATGSPTKGEGTIDIYFGGELLYKFRLHRNADLFVGECAIDLEFVKTPCDIQAQKVFYPCLDRKK